MATIRKQYSSNYQVFEVVQEIEDLFDNDKVEEICVKMDEIAAREIKSMLGVVGVFDSTKQPATSQKTDVSNKASEKQLGVIKKNLAKCKMIASELGINLDSSTLTVKEAKQIIDKLFSANNNGF